jgi:hypothetical protein
MFGNRRDRGFIRELVGAWIVTLLVVALGLAVTSHHVPEVRNRVAAPQWYDPPVAGAEPWENEASSLRGTDAITSQTDNSITVDLPPICDTIAGSASDAQPPAPGPSPMDLNYHAELHRSGSASMSCR